MQCSAAPGRPIKGFQRGALTGGVIYGGGGGGGGNDPLSSLVLYLLRTIFIEYL